MKHAIIMTGGKQYRVAEGDFLKVETLNADVEGEVVFNEVLAVSTEEGLKVGTPVVEGAAVTAKTPFSALLLSTALPFPQMS